jgi:diphthamide biosynthesis protein 2
MKHFVPLEVSDRETDVSLITGGIRNLNTDANHENQIRQEMMKRDDALSVLHYSGAGEFLINRTWTGLEQKLGETPVTKAVEGRKGIASSYSHETE